MPRRIYLDHAATTPVLPEVVEAMAPWLERDFGNPSSLYEEGRNARAAIDQAREIISAAMGCLFAEVLFTSSGTESANMAILGAALGNTDKKRSRILFGAAEHHCVLNTQPLLERLGYRVELIRVDREAAVDLSHLATLLDDRVLLVSVMHANNELGTLQPVKEVAALTDEVGALYHCDAVQTFCTGVWSDWTTKGLGADLITLAAHKLNGPKGAGALYVKAGTKVSPILRGGGQEREMRAGTEDVAAIVGFAAAVTSHATLSHSNKQYARDAFKEHVQPAALFSVTGTPTLGGHLHLRFPGIAAEPMLILLDQLGVSASSGSACSSGSLEPSHVLRACGYSEREASEGLRFTFGVSSTVKEAGEAAHIVLGAASRLKGNH